MDKELIDILKEKKIGIKSLFREFDELNSYFSLIFEQLDRSENKKLQNDFISYWRGIDRAIKTIFIVNSEDQVLYNLRIELPLKTHFKNEYGTLVINFEKDRGNFYDESAVTHLERAMEQMEDIFSVLVPDSKLVLEKEIAKVEEGKKKFIINLYVEKNGEKIALENESTGGIKLVSLLFALISYVQDEDGIVIIDELDSHIFEYLLATIIENLSDVAKGQLIFTLHNLLPMERLNRKSIILATFKEGDTSYVYFSRGSDTTNFRQKYIRAQAMWSDKNITPLGIKEYGLKLYLRKLVSEYED